MMNDSLPITDFGRGAVSTKEGEHRELLTFISQILLLVTSGRYHMTDLDYYISYLHI